MTRVSVVIPTYQRSERLPGLVAGLEAQTLPREDFEVVICNDSSTDDTAEVLDRLVAETSLNLRVMTTERNSGPAHARNIAWRATTAPILAFVDDDCIPTPRWLEAGLARFDETDIGIIQGRTVPAAKDGRIRWAVTQEILQFSNRYETCNIFYRRNVLEAVGGFDETIYFFGEDTVAGWEARRRGVASGFELDALVHHAVAYPGFPYFWRYAKNHQNFPLLIRRFPEMRREVLWKSFFVRRIDAAFVGAVVGIAVGTVWRPALALAAPYVWHRRPRALQRDAIVDQLLLAALDGATVAGCAIGSVRQRTLVL